MMMMKTAKIKKVLLLRSTFTLWRRAAKVIPPFWFLLWCRPYRR